MAGVGEGGGRGNLRVAKTPPLQSALAGIPLRCIATDHHLRPHGHQRERRMGGSRRGAPRRDENRGPHGWRRMGHGMGMVAQWAGESSRCEDPAPTVGVCGDALAHRIAIPMSPLPPPPCACHTTHGEPRFYNRGGMGREGAWGWAGTRGWTDTRGWAGNFRPAPTAPPLPRAQQWQAGLLQEAPQEAEKTLKSQAYKR